MLRCTRQADCSAEQLPQNPRRANHAPDLSSRSMQRSDGRAPDEIRPVNFELNVAPHASGSVLVSMGNTRVICAVTIEEAVPRWMKEQAVTGGWLTAEYSMLPYSTEPRKPRDVTKGRIDGRSVEIQRLIGRSLRAVMDLEKLGPRTIWVDCDVLQADGGTRTTAITGASLALAIACRKLVREKKLDSPPMLKLAAAVSAGILDGRSATTHWESLQRMRDTFPNVTVRDDLHVVNDGNIFTSAGISAGIDMTLHLVALMYGAAVGRATARHMEYPVPESNARRVEAQYIASAR